MRDAGMPMEEVKAKVKSSALQSMGDPESIIKDKEDVDGFTDLVDVIYLRKDVSPEVIYNVILTSCLSSALVSPRATSE